MISAARALPNRSSGRLQARAHERIPILTNQLIVIAGMSRGGTNLLWNIVQSHPDVIDSYYELNEIFGGKTGIGLLDKARIELEALGHIPCYGVARTARRRLHHYAALSFHQDRFNREKFPGVDYREQDLESLTICTKLVSAWEVDPMRKLLKRNDALKYLPLLRRGFPQMKVIFLVRNGLAVAEGWGRRGASIETAIKWYRRYVQFYENYVASNPRQAMIVRFDTILSDPFAAAETIFENLGLAPTRLDHLRIAVKPTIRSNTHVENRTQKNKIWLSPDNWREYLDDSIDQAQIEKLQDDARRLFIDENAEVMKRYGQL